MKVNAIPALVLTALAFGILLSPHPVLGNFALVTCVIGLKLLWKPHISPIFAFIFGYQWLQASTMVLEAVVRGEPIQSMSRFGGDVVTSTALSLTGLLFLATGIRCGLRSGRRNARPSEEIQVRDKPPHYWFACYAALFVLAVLVQKTGLVPGALRQPVLALVAMKWAFFWLLTQAAAGASGRALWLLMIAFSVEFVLGFTGYFSHFSAVLFFTFFGLVAAGARMTAARWLMAGVLSSATLVLGIAWTAVKTEHREFLSAGQRAQSVTTTTGESLRNVVRLFSELDAEEFGRGARQLTQRIAYVEFFGLVLDNVPQYIPFEDGALWRDALLRPLMPRLFFPDKTEIDDSQRTNYYTDAGVSGKDEGTSVSLGYMAESYIDFGRWGMMAVIFLLGLGYGKFYRFLVNYRYCRGVVGAAFATAALYQAAYLETSVTKLIGGIAVAMLVACLLARVMGPLLHRGKARPRHLAQLRDR